MSVSVRKRFGPRAFLAATVSAALLAAGCAGAGESAGEGDTTFSFALPSAPNSLDIAKDYTGTTQQIMATVTEPLERVSGTGEVRPNLNAEFAQPNPLTLVYRLREGVRFSDGAVMTSADVSWSLNHVLDTQAGAQTAGTAASIASVAATGPLEVTVKLKYSDPTARASLAAIGLIQEKAFAEAHQKDLGTPSAAPVGTGPYRVEANSPQQITLARNPNYSGTRPVPDTLGFVFIAQDNSAQLAMRSGSIQGAGVLNLKNSPEWAAINGAMVVALPSLYQSFLALDAKTSPLDDVHVRKAIAYSLDRTGLAKSIYGDHGSALDGLLLPASLNSAAPSEADAKAFTGSLPRYPFDLTKAKAELAKSAHPSGFTLEVPYISGTQYSELTILNLAQNMKQLGVDIRPKAQTSAQWSSTVYGHQNLGIQILSWVPSVPDPAGTLGQLTGEENMAAQHFNLANYSTPAAEEAHTQLVRSTDKAQRWAAIKTLLSAVAEDVPYVPLYHVDTYVALGGGFTFATTPDDFDLHVNGTWVSQLKKS
ncbi:ABC transporter substrate-binding protein [Amycolatopsis rubida]|uniref:Peptide/nickel transport system substrate-binding protein n=1 Tax=Amycolatopsis rubida TaxID=112413 RepID=A0A1I5TFN2_9PSEU|nr:ABC transporter substrate-binding protein [Amycolatopsis rubida]SFP81882.1 peptide/nickel transport system substrate-binding protein [Amycolatopsis rubida]